MPLVQAYVLRLEWMGPGRLRAGEVVTVDRRQFLTTGGKSLGALVVAHRLPQSLAKTHPIERFNVLRFGAVGNGLIDDRPAIQAAIRAAVKGRGGIVVIPEGTYLLGGQLNVMGNGVSILGAGPETILRVGDGVLHDLPGARHALHVQGNRFKLAHLTIDGNASGQEVAPNLDLVQLGGESENGNDGVSQGRRYRELVVQDCRMFNAVIRHIRVNKCSGVTVAKNQLSGVTENLSVGVGNIKLRWVRRFAVTENVCDLGGVARPSSNNILITHSGNSGSGSSSGEIRGNTVSDSTDSPIEASSAASGSGLNATVHNIVIADNVVQNGAGIITLQTQDVVIENNVIVQPGINGGNAWGIRLGNSVGSTPTTGQKNVLVQGNEVRGAVGDATVGTKYGILVDPMGGQVEGISLVGNRISDVPNPGRFGIRVRMQEGAGLTLDQNTFENVATPLAYYP